MLCGELPNYGGSKIYLCCSFLSEEEEIIGFCCKFSSSCGRKLSMLSTLLSEEEEKYVQFS